MEPKRCKQCTYIIDPGCIHPDCEDAHAQDFCSVPCRTAWYAIMDYELQRARKEVA